MPRNCHVF